MSGLDMSAFRMSNAAAAKPPNPPPTICAFICPLPETPGWELLPTRGCPGNRRGPEQTSASAETDAAGCYRAAVDVMPTVRAIAQRVTAFGTDIRPAEWPGWVDSGRVCKRHNRLFIDLKVRSPFTSTHRA